MDRSVKGETFEVVRLATVPALYCITLCFTFALGLDWPVLGFLTALSTGSALTD